MHHHLLRGRLQPHRLWLINLVRRHLQVRCRACAVAGVSFRPLLTRPPALPAARSNNAHALTWATGFCDIATCEGGYYRTGSGDGSMCRQCTCVRTAAAACLAASL